MKNKINIIFDFDGVIVDSNKIKTDAFRTISATYGDEISSKLVNYHIQRGGISRFEKIRWFVENLLDLNDEILINHLIDLYSKQISKLLSECKLRTDIKNLKNKLINTSWSIASGGSQEEIINFLHKKRLLKIFDSGVFGSPTPKLEIVKKIKNNVDPFSRQRWVLIGDSIYDYRCAILNDIKFVFAKDWSEIDSKEEFISKNDLDSINGIEFLSSDYLENLF